MNDTKNETIETKHTPGPWHVVDCDAGLWVEGDNRTDVVCNLEPRVVFYSHEDMSNALLISAAPDLLEAALITQRTVEGNFADGYTIRVTGHEMNAIRAAIAKATGHEVTQ